VLPVERYEVNRHPSQGIPEDVYWCREGGTYNCLNYVRASDATIVADTTPDKITHLEPNEIFVFGSNYAGRHGRGAALTALRKFGAINGQGCGPMGRSYGIATKDKHLRVLPLHTIKVQVARFLHHAAQHPEKRYLVTPIGCGLAGYCPRDIATFFQDAPANVVLPASFTRLTQPAPAG
jgi:hypothetical protein